MAPTPAFLPGKFHGQRSLVGYSPWTRKRVGHSDQITTNINTFLELKYYSHKSIQNYNIFGSESAL